MIDKEIVNAKFQQNLQFGENAHLKLCVKLTDNYQG